MDGMNYQDTPNSLMYLLVLVPYIFKINLGCGIREEKIAVIGYPKILYSKWRWL